MSLIIKAAHFAKAKHEGQVRQFSGAPYITHPARVAGMVGLLPNATEDMIAVAYLHDVLEDTNTSIFELDSLFGPVIGKMVIDLTNVSLGSKEPRAERKKRDLEYLKTTAPEIRQIKLLDRLDNLREMDGAKPGFLRLYGQESFNLVQAIGDVEPSISAEILKLAARFAQVS